MKHRAILFLLAAGTGGCGSSGGADAGGERFASLGSDEGCAAVGSFDTPAITVAAGPLKSSVPRAVVPKDGGVWFTDSQDVTVSALDENGLLRRFPAPFPSEAVFDAAVAADGSVWFDIVSADLVARLGRMMPDGETALVAIPSGERARRLTAGSDNAIWFTAGQSIGRVALDGFVHQIDVGAETGDLATGSDGSVWFTEPSSNRIGRFGVDGIVTHFDVPSAHSGLSAIALGPDGHVWFTEANTGKIGQIDHAGVVREHAAVAPPLRPKELAAGPDGRLWFTLESPDARHPRVGSLSPCGDVALVELPALSDPFDFRPPIDVPATPYGIAGGDDEMWVTARLEPFETGAVLRLGLEAQAP